MTQMTCTATAKRASWRDYLELCKPRVVALLMLTALVGMCLASPHWIGWSVCLLGNIGIGLAACSAAVINHLVDRHLDQKMRRTKNRPLVQGKVTPAECIIFATILCALSMCILACFINTLTAVLTFITVIGYAGIYTIYLKHATPQNIVIGGITGAAPPLLGWCAVTGHIAAEPLLLVLIIFIWTPPHFWALAIYRIEDYAKAEVPMLPNTHGIAYTKLNILLYTILLVASTYIPFAINTSGYIYTLGVTALNARFLYWAIKLYRNDEGKIAIQTFRYSIMYLMYLFIFLLIDHYLGVYL